MLALLRHATTRDHEAVDALFGPLDLAEPGTYAGFLQSHARALQPVESYLRSAAGLPRWRARWALLEADLAELDAAAPEPLPFAPPDLPGAAWGVLYVVDGSRLGNVVLSRSVPDDWPARFLRARHEAGEWRALTDALDAQGEVMPPSWREGAVAGARACFDLYRRAA